MDFINNSGDSITWDVQVHSTGSHALTFRYANGTTTRRVMRLTVDTGYGFTSHAVWFNPTGSWETWKTVTFHVPMAAHGRVSGINQVKLQATGRSGPNVDSLSIRRPAPQRP